MSAGLGHGAFGDSDGAVTGLSLRADRIMSPRLALGAQFALLLPLVESDDAFLANLLVEIVYRNLAGGIVDGRTKQFQFQRRLTFIKTGVAS